MKDRTDSDFCIEIDYQKGSGSPSRVFRAMSDLIDALQETDQALIRSIDGRLESVMLLEDVETGSVRSWIRQAVNSVDDAALESGDYKKVVGKYLVKSKYVIIRFLDKRIDLANAKDLKELESELSELAEETQVRRLSAYQPVPREKLVGSIEKINNALAPLNDDDRATFITGDEKVEFNLTLHIAPETVEELITAEIIDSVSTMIVKVKKPDFLGASQWEFHWDNRTIPATILDLDWLADYQNGRVMLSPGDAIRAEVLTRVQYGFARDVVGTRYGIVKVLEVIPKDASYQAPLFAKDAPKSDE